MLKGHTVVCTTSARDALARLANGEKFDIIFSDLMMPDMTGAAFFEELLQGRLEDASRVVFMTGGALTEKMADFLATVPNPRLMKPFNLQSVRTLVQELLGKRASRERL